MARHEQPRADELQTPWDQVVAVIGEAAAIRLAKIFGGRPLYIPMRPGEHHPLTAAIGLKASLALARAYGGARFDIPLSPGKRARIIELDRAGWKRGQIALEVGCTERHVYKVIAADKAAAPAPPTLFD